jgi:hypothetical protein
MSEDKSPIEDIKVFPDDMPNQLGAGLDGSLVVSPTCAGVGIGISETKSRYSLMPWDALDEVAELMAKSADKHGETGYRHGRDWGGEIDSLMRHMSEFIRGGDTDMDSNMPILAHVAARALILLSMQINGVGNDTRLNT